MMTRRLKDLQRALELLERYGEDPISWHALESPFQHWFSGDGFVGFFDTARAWVAAGPPVGPEDSIETLARDFVAAAKAHGRRAVFFGAECDLAMALAGRSLRIGLRPYWDARDWSLDGPQRSSLRYQIRRAARNGVRVRRLLAADLENPDSPLRDRIEWLEHIS